MVSNLDGQSLAGDRIVVAAGNRRYGFLLSWMSPLLLLVSALLTLASGNGAWLWALMLSAYFGVPVFDFIFGRDNSNPSPMSEMALQQDQFYVYVLYGCVALHWIAFLCTAYVIAAVEVPWFYLLGGMLSAGLSNGIAVVAGHELGHKVTDNNQSLAARIVLAMSAFGHYSIVHNNDHHRLVATPQDHSSARMGENIYRFFLREVSGSFRRAWRLQVESLHRQGRSRWSLQNRMLQTTAMTGIAYGALLLFFGVIMAPYLLIASVFAWWQLSSASYVEHYGLLRTRQTDGSYERWQVRHAWNSNYRFSNLMLLQVQRHSDHHQHPSRPYQILRAYDDMPMMPQGYPSMFLLALFPPLWFALIDPRVLRWAGNDLEKINIDPGHRDRLYARYATAAGPSH